MYAIFIILGVTAEKMEDLRRVQMCKRKVIKRLGKKKL